MPSCKQTQIMPKYVIILLCALYKYVLSEDLPDLQVKQPYYESTWENITNETLYEHTAWIGTIPGLRYLILNCTALYPIQWTFTGNYFPSSDIYFQYPRQLEKNSTYYLRVDNNFEKSKESFDWAVSARVSCEKVGNPKVRKSILLFVRRKNSSQRFLGSSEQTVSDSKLIPCPTSDPTVMPSLHVRTNEGVEKQVIDPQVKYNFYEGFHSNKTFSGVYTCRSGNATTRVNASVTPAPAVESFEVVPQRSSIRVFLDENIHFACKSKLAKQGKLDLEDASGRLIFTYSKFGDSATVSVNPFQPLFGPKETKFQGTGKCILVEHGQTVVVKKWSYEFLEAPELDIFQYDGQVTCLTNLNNENASIHVFRCHNKMECSFFSNFFDHDTTIRDLKSQRHFFSSEIVPCMSRKREHCVETLYPFASGLVQCRLHGIVKEWEFFTSLDNRKYTNWREALETELLRMKKDKLSNGFVHFFCTAVWYLFAGSIYFEIEFRNGSRNVLEHNGNTVNISFSSEKENQVTWLYFARILDIILPEDTAAIHCVAFFWNTTEFLRTSSYFDTEKENSGEGVLYSVLGSVGISVICVLAVLLVISVKRHKNAQQLLRSLTDEEVEQFLKGRPELLGNGELTNIETVDMLPFPKEYEIPLADLQFDSGKNFLGFGNFSYVVRGEIKAKRISVAIKISKPSANVDFFKSLLSEVKIMVYMGKHENVVTLAGVCTENIKNRSIHIATDVCELGDLKNYLIKARPSFVNIINANQEIDISLLTENTSEQLNILDLIRFSCEIAKGMEYLAYKSIIHADLAARNVLLTSDKVAKVSDFGLSKKLYENSNYVKKSSTPLPWRWMALESLTTLTFSTSSDVWAYGVTLFEIFSLGDTPYPNEEWNVGFVSRLKDGIRMGRPNHSTKEIYTLMSECWEREPEFRPSFSTIRSFFEKLSGRYFDPRASSKYVGAHSASLDNENLELEPAITPNIVQSCQMECEVHIAPEEVWQETEYLELDQIPTVKPQYDFDSDDKI